MPNSQAPTDDELTKWNASHQQLKNLQSQALDSISEAAALSAVKALERYVLSKSYRDFCAGLRKEFSDYSKYASYHVLNFSTTDYDGSPHLDFSGDRSVAEHFKRIIADPRCVLLDTAGSQHEPLSPIL